MKLYRGQKNSDELAMNDPEMSKGSNIRNGYYFTTDRKFANIFGEYIITMDVDEKDILKYKDRMALLQEMGDKVTAHLLNNSDPDHLEEGMALGHLDCFADHTGKHFIETDESGNELIYFPEREYEFLPTIYAKMQWVKASSFEGALCKAKKMCETLPFGELVSEVSLQDDDVELIE